MWDNRGTSGIRWPLHEKRTKPFRPDSQQAGSSLNASSPKGCPSMRSGWNSAWGYQGSTSIGGRALRSPASLFVGWRTENKPLRPLLRFRHRETPFAQLQGTPDAQSYVAAFRFNRYRAGYRQPSTSFVGYRTEKARRFSAGTCPPRPDITAAHCCHLCGHLPASPTN